MASQSLGDTAWGSRNRKQDWILLVLAIWLFISPWVLQFGSGLLAVGGTAVAHGPPVEASRAAWDAWILGIVVCLVAMSAVGQMDVRQEWVALVLGAWIFVAPWVLGFTSLPRASWDHWIVGALVFLVALWIQSAARGVPISTTAAPPLGGRSPIDPPVPPVGPPGNRVP